MAGRPRLPIGTFGEIRTIQVASGRFRAWARFRDWDGQTQQLTATGTSRDAAATSFKIELAARMRVPGAADSLTADSSFTMPADAWLEDLRLDVDRSDGTKEVYARELRSLAPPTFECRSARGWLLAGEAGTDSTAALNG